ncbi:unnamed protein product [Coregonus sp. 'balchen']|nr:unnamed protein product [Coregonus sp. 'balchen']
MGLPVAAGYDRAKGEVMLYRYGWQDCTTILFYFFITIILHAVVQEYVLDVKLFFLTQLAYWLHALPELYFQKVRKEEIPRQLQYICLYLLHISAAYLLKFDLWAVNFVFTRMVTLTLVFLAVGFGLARAENQGLDWNMGNFNTVLIRHAQAARKRAAAKQTPRPLKRDSLGHHENGTIKAENGASPRPKKIKAP